MRPYKTAAGPVADSEPLGKTLVKTEMSAVGVCLITFEGHSINATIDKKILDFHIQKAPDYRRSIGPTAIQMGNGRRKSLVIQKAFGTILLPKLRILKNL